MYEYDSHGWYCGQAESGRVTPIEPANQSTSATPGGLRANWTGYAWVDRPYIAPVVSPFVLPVPSEVSRAQGKAALIVAGLWPAVLAYVGAIPDPTDKALAEVALNDTQEWRRDSLFLNSAASALGLTSAQLDQLFVDASGIVF